MSGVSGSGGMSMNCKMQGMLDSSKTEQKSQKTSEEIQKQQYQQQRKSLDNVRGTKFDVSL